MDGKRRKIKLNMYQKFAVAIAALGLFPMLIFSAVIVNIMLENYRKSLQANYEQAAIHISSSVENMLSVYNNASKMVYQYKFGAEGGVQDSSSDYDNLRQVLTGEGYEPEQAESQREREMRLFLDNVENVDGYVYAVHFLADSEETGQLSFHYSLRNTFFQDEALFTDSVGYGDWDRESRMLQLIPTHETDYYHGYSGTVGRQRNRHGGSLKRH